MKKAAVTIALLFVLIFLNYNFLYAATTIYERKKEEKISSGVTLYNYEVFNEKGWNNINILEVSIKDNNTKLGLLTPDTGLNKFQTVLQMANKNNIIAAINGDFFAGNSKNGNTIGFSVSEGELFTSTYYENKTKNTFASFVLDEDENVWIDYFTNEIEFKKTRGNESIDISEINKIPLNFDKPLVYTKKWGEKLEPIVSELPLTIIVVEEDKIEEVTSESKEIEIPEDGFVVVGYGVSAEYLKNNFEKRDRVKLEIEMDLDIDEIKMAVSGGALLVEKGEIPSTFSANVSGVNPRTAIGISKDEKTVYLITVDGRQAQSMGMTQTELAEFLQSKNIYNAMNLDGGGSTTMVARKLGKELISPINLPSGGTLRLVTNAIGVYNTTNTSSLNGIKLETEENVFVGLKKKITVLGYDKYFNPVSIDLNDIKWSYEGVPIEVNKDVITAGSEAGTANITASIGKVKGTISIDVLSMPNEIVVTPKRTLISSGDTVKFSLIAKNKNGYYATLNDNEVEWKIVSGDGKIENMTYYPRTEGTTILSVSAGKAISYVLVEVGEDTNTRIPEDIRGEDEKQKPNTSSGDTFKIMVNDEKKEEKTLLDRLTNKKVDLLTSGDTDVMIFTSQNSGYKVEEKDEATFINLDVSSGGLRLTDASAWTKFQKDISKAKTKNVIVLMKGNLDSFTDAQERKLFIDVMYETRRDSNKNVWIICNGDYTGYSMERGVKYLFVNNSYIDKNNITEVIENTKYIVITIENNEMTYEIKRVHD